MKQTESIGISRRRLFEIAGFPPEPRCSRVGHCSRKRKGSFPPWSMRRPRQRSVVQPIRRNISVLEGSGGNIAVLTGPDGKLLVEAGFAVSRPAITSALASINADPIKHLINTHWHTDHTDGNAWLHAAGAEITAHENTLKRLSVATRVEGWEWTFPAAPAGALPVKVFASEYEMHRNNTRITHEILRAGPYRQRCLGQLHRCRCRPCWRHLVEWCLPVYRLLYRRQHRWPDPGG